MYEVISWQNSRGITVGVVGAGRCGEPSRQLEEKTMMTMLFGILMLMVMRLGVEEEEILGDENDDKIDLDLMKMIKLTWGAAKAEATRERITKGVILSQRGQSILPR